MAAQSEKAILEFIDAFKNAIADPNSQTKFQKDIDKSWLISSRFDVAWRWLQKAVPHLPPELRNDLQPIIERAFAHIKETRNTAGHPMGVKIERNTMLCNMYQFPVFCKRIYDLRDYFAANQVTI